MCVDEAARIAHRDIFDELERIRHDIEEWAWELDHGHTYAAPPRLQVVERLRRIVSPYGPV